MKFYSCNWIVIPTAGFTKLADLSDNLDCGLRIIRDVYLDDDGIFRLQFGTRHQSQEIIDKFIECIPTEMNITNWKPTSEEIYLNGKGFSEYWNALEPLEQGSWMDVIIRNGYLNQRDDSS